MSQEFLSHYRTLVKDKLDARLFDNDKYIDDFLKAEIQNHITNALNHCIEIPQLFNMFPACLEQIIYEICNKNIERTKPNKRTMQFMDSHQEMNHKLKEQFLKTLLLK